MHAVLTLPEKQPHIPSLYQHAHYVTEVCVQHIRPRKIEKVWILNWSECWKKQKGVRGDMQKTMKGLHRHKYRNLRRWWSCHSKNITAQLWTVQWNSRFNLFTGHIPLHFLQCLSGFHQAGQIPGSTPFLVLEQHSYQISQLGSELKLDLRLQ